MKTKKETKRERFIRLAQKRTDKVLDGLRVLGGCANRRIYDYNPTDIEKIKNAINEELDHIIDKFSDKKEFTLYSTEDSVTKGD